MLTFLRKLWPKQEKKKKGIPPVDTESLVVLSEYTPNPKTMKFVVSRTLLSHGSLNFTSSPSSEVSPLATRLFNIPLVKEVFIGQDFVSITKSDEGEWASLEQWIIREIREHLASGALIVQESAIPSDRKEKGDASTVEARIQEVLDREIRPAVQMDGGDVIFAGYENGLVKLLLQGACSGCPSSTMTLRMGIEYRLKELIPEIEAVEAVPPEI